ncbi:MAG: FliA/WhiG family RNA polymerase sigma factor [Myxococcales bacterium]
MSQAPVGRSPTRGREDDNALYERFMPLVRRIAMRTIRTLPASLTFDDILSAGWVGMAEALQRRTDEMQDEHFEAYASYRVRGAILDYLRVLDPLSRKLRGASRRITEAASDLTNRLGRVPNEDEIAGELGLSLPAYQELLMEVSEAGFARLEISAIAEPASFDPSPEAITSQAEIVDGIAGAIDQLPERLRLVLALHYQEECSLREIGEVLGVTESRVCQLHAEAVHLIRAKLEARPRKIPGLEASLRR